MIPWCPLDKRLDESQRWSGGCGEVKNLFTHPGIKLQFFNCPTRSPVTIPTELFRLSYTHTHIMYMSLFWVKMARLYGIDSTHLRSM
jgi:hypothetical protein